MKNHHNNILLATFVSLALTSSYATAVPFVLDFEDAEAGRQLTSYNGVSFDLYEDSVRDDFPGWIVMGSENYCWCVWDDDDYSSLPDDNTYLLNSYGSNSMRRPGLEGHEPTPQPGDYRWTLNGVRSDLYFGIHFPEEVTFLGLDFGYAYGSGGDAPGATSATSAVDLLFLDGNLDLVNDQIYTTELLDQNGDPVADGTPVGLNTPINGVQHIIFERQNASIHNPWPAWYTIDNLRYDRATQFAGGIEYGDELCGLAEVISVPEPSTFSLLLTGSGLMAFSLRRRNRVSVSNNKK